jgi:hypothetical protein
MTVSFAVRTRLPSFADAAVEVGVVRHVDRRATIERLARVSLAANDRGATVVPAFASLGGAETSADEERRGCVGLSLRREPRQLRGVKVPRRHSPKSRRARKQKPARHHPRGLCAV